TAATDLFSVGAIAWSLWSGERLPGEWTARGEPLERPEGMPAGVWDVVAILLRVEPDARTATLDDLQVAIAHAGATSHDPRSPDEALPTAPAEYAVGSLIADRYEVREKLGAGTFSTVYRVFDPFAGLERAVKVLHPAYGIDRAQREVQLLENLRHDNVVRVRHVDRTRTEPPQVYIVSELAPGVPLSALTSADEPLPVEEAVAIVDGLLDACEHFHPGPADGAEPGAGPGVVHRDIKPANVMYDRATGTVKLLDFNVASPS